MNPSINNFPTGKLISSPLPLCSFFSLFSDFIRIPSLHSSVHRSYSPNLYANRLFVVMDNNTEAGGFSANFQIPVDLFVSKKQKALVGGGAIRFIDSSGDLVFSVVRKPNDSYISLSRHKHLLLDSSGNPLISIRHQQSGCWECYNGDISKTQENNFLFRVERTVHTLSRTECDVFMVKQDFKDLKPDFKMKGCPFQRSCTIYSGNSIVAQTSLMYKLGMQKVLVPRNKFRLTIFPGLVDHSLVVAMIVIFFDGRKYWI